MNLSLIDNKGYKNEDYTKHMLTKAEYNENSSFSSVFNFTIHQSENTIKKSLFSKDNVIA